MRSPFSREFGTVSLAEMALLMLFIVLVIWLWVKPFRETANNVQESDREILNKYQVLDLMPINTLVPPQADD